MTNTKEITLYQAEIYIWSRIGHCPLTKRTGAYCDELAHVTIGVTSLEEAAKAVEHMLKTVPDANKGHYNVADYPNQNLRTRWF